MTALIVAAMSGVDVRVMIPHKTDHALVYWASLSHVEELLKAGVKVYRYEKGFIHSKILIADGSAVSVGTANLDARSLEINFEVQAFIYDASVAADFIRAYENDMVESPSTGFTNGSGGPSDRRCLNPPGVSGRPSSEKKI